MIRKIQTDELNRISVEEYGSLSNKRAVIVLDNLRSAHNVGSVFRSSDAFGISKLYLCGITVKPPSKELHKTAIGATNSVAWEYAASITDVLMDLKKQGFRLVGVEQTNKSIELQTFKYSTEEKYAFVFGNEVNGLSEEALGIIDEFIEIPQFGTKHSFNVSVSAGIVMWDFYYKKNAVSK